MLAFIFQVLSSRRMTYNLVVFKKVGEGLVCISDNGQIEGRGSPASIDTPRDDADALYRGVYSLSLDSRKISICLRQLGG